MTFWDGTQWVNQTQTQTDAPRHRTLRRFSGAALEGGLITVLVFGLIAGSALARGGHAGTTGHGGSSVSISVPNGVFGGTTTPTVSVPGAWVYNACSQSGRVVGQEWVQTDGAGHATLHLGPSMLWPSGSATCTAQAGTWNSKGSWVTEGSTTFSVSG
jgi:hypothetical protein